jgi:hypothetical protein
LNNFCNERDKKRRLNKWMQHYMDIRIWCQCM